MPRVPLKRRPAVADQLGMERARHAMPSRPWALAAALGLAVAVGYPLLPFSRWTELSLYDGSVLVALVAALAGWRRAEGRMRLAWLLSAAGLALYLAGELVWWWYDLIGQEPFPSIGDAFFLVGYVPLAVAAAVLAAVEGERDRTAWLDVGVLVLVAGLVFWSRFMEPRLDEAGSDHLALLVTFAYPIADLLIIGFLLRLLFAGRLRSGPVAAFALGMVAMLVGDIAFSVIDLSAAGYEAGEWPDGVWIAGYLLMGFAPVLPARRDDAAGQRRRAAGDTGRLVIVVGAITVPASVLIASLAGRGLLGSNTPTIAALVSVGVMVLVGVRLWGLLGRARAAEARRGSERVSAFVHHSSDAIVLLDRERRIAFASPAAEMLLGLEGAPLLGSALTGAFAEDDQAGLERLLGSLDALGTGATVALEGTVVRAGRLPRSVEGTGSNLLEDPAVGGTLVTLHDVTERAALEAQLRRQAFHDDLTGLANRALFADRVANALHRTAREPDAHVAVLFIDLDDFKAVNDGMGHSAGDELLCGVASRLQAGLRPGDTVARLGGDEFAVLVEGVPSSEYASDVAARLLELLALPIQVGGVALAVPASIGVTVSSPASTVDSLLRDADIAMYTAKSEGKGRVAMFDEALREAAARRLALKIELPEALHAGQFRLEYQPIHTVRDGGLAGFEALLRWDRPDGRTVQPADFVPAAEESGAIVEIGAWVLEEACRQAVVWNAGSQEQPLAMHVNVSAVQLHAPSFAAELADVLERTGLPARLLTVEITESVMAEPERISGVLDQLRDIGVGIAIDDFGTGYSSLSYLQRFPVTSVKIDRSFVSGLAGGGDPSLVRSIVALAEALGLDTVAEGVETHGELGGLEALDCQLAQGFLLGRPQTPAAVAALLAGERTRRTA